jgi:hypothetical protein
MSSPRIIYKSHSDRTPRTPARLAALRFILDCHAKKEAATSPVSRPDDARKDQDAGTYPHCT